MGISNIILEANNISKFFKEGSNKVEVLLDSSFSISKGEMVSFVGPSGCGKTTLLQICGLLDSPNSGNLIINGTNTVKLNDKEKTIIRRSNIGFVYQMHNLFPEFSAIENVLLPSIISKKNSRKEAEYLLNKLGLFDKKNNMPSELSGGEKQRVAIARALINKPSLILADEPTGNLDYKNSLNVMDLFLSLVKEFNISLFMVSHNEELSNLCNRRITIIDKRIVEDNSYLSKTSII